MTPDQAKRLSLAEQHDWFRRATSRRSLLRGGILGAGAVVAGPALLGGTAGAVTTRSSTPMLLASASGPSGSVLAPFGRHIAYGADPTSQMSVAWQVAAPVNSPFVRVGSTPADLGERIAAQIRTVTTPMSDITAVDSVAPSAPATI
jgi:hypothetical protein